MQPREPRCCTLPWRQVSFSKAWRCFMARKCCKTSRASGRCAPPSLGPATARRAIHHHPRPGRRGAFRPNAPGKMQIERRVSLFRFSNLLYKFYKTGTGKSCFSLHPCRACFGRTRQRMGNAGAGGRVCAAINDGGGCAFHLPLTPGPPPPPPHRPRLRPPRRPRHKRRGGTSPSPPSF